MKQVEHSMISSVRNHLRARSVAAALVLENRLGRILSLWLLFAGFASAVRIALAPSGFGTAELSSITPYALLIMAPFASTLLALHWFADGENLPQPSLRLSRLGRWRNVSLDQARRHPLFGASGIMVSLMLGMMLNVPVRAAEYLVAMPPIPADSPHWLLTLRTMMTLDVVLFTSLYMVAFVAALRRVPLFPRLLVAIWVCDLAMQMGIAQAISGTGAPANVATALHGLLDGNVKKVLISVALWSPYLMLSTRVNVTYRRRIAA